MIIRTKTVWNLSFAIFSPIIPNLKLEPSFLQRRKNKKWCVELGVFTVFLNKHTAQKVFVFGVILVLIFSHSDWIRRDKEFHTLFSPNARKIWTRIPNTDTFHAVASLSLCYCKEFFLIYAMSGKNCSIQSCYVSRRSKYKGVSISKVPSSDLDFKTNWRNNLASVITKDRFVDTNLRDGINNEQIFIYQQYFRIDQCFKNELNYQTYFLVGKWFILIIKKRFLNAVHIH